MTRLDSAHELWDQRWAAPTERAKWSVPEPEVVALMALLHDRHARRVLDLGAGVGRHALTLAHAGFEVTAVDASVTGLEALRTNAAEQGVVVDVRAGRFVDLPLGDDSVDHVLAWNTIYHGDRTLAGRALTECRRVLRPGGSCHLTMLSKRNSAFGVGTEVAPDTFVDEASTDDKGHPHFYVDAVDLVRMLVEAQFQPVSVVDVDHSPPGGFHWHVLAEG